MHYCPPLKDRIIKSNHPTFINDVSNLQTRPPKYKSWSEGSMKRAFNAVINNGYSVRQAAEEFNVPKSTLGDRVSGRTQMGSISGPAKILTDKEEDELVNFLIGCSSIGYAKSRVQVIALINNMYKLKGIQRCVTNGWWESFCRRHPDLTLRVAPPLSKGRSAASSSSILDRYFDILEETLEEYDLIDKPNQIFNMDESGMPFQPKSPKGVFARGERHPFMFASGNKGQLTVVGCVNAAGFCMPPMVILDRKTLAPSFTHGEVPGTIYGLSDSGWIDQELFDLWFKSHFLKYVPSARPVILLMDGHKSHYNVNTIRVAAKEQVILFTLPPNSTHLSQPLDRSCFGPLKVCWSHNTHQYMADNPGKIVTRFSFSPLFRKAWMTSMTSSNIVAGFEVTGIYPFNRDVFKKDSKSSENSIAEQTGLSYIPLVTPTKRSRRRLNQYSDDESLSANELLQTSHDTSVYSDDEGIDESVKQLPQRSDISRLLQIPVPDEVVPPRVQEKSSRVLTSAENLKILKQKEQEKEEKARVIAEKKVLRELKKAAKNAQFTEEELELFERRYENGFDLDHDLQYNKWKMKFHPNGE